jgi:hypothetical protein
MGRAKERERGCDARQLKCKSNRAARAPILSRFSPVFAFSVCLALTCSRASLPNEFIRRYHLPRSDEATRRDSTVINLRPKEVKPR